MMRSSSQQGDERKDSIVSSEYDPGSAGARRESGYDYDDDGGSLTSLPAELPPPPDGGYGWVITFVSFLANMIVDGVAYSFSPFMDTFTTYFNEPAGKVAWVPSLLSGVYLSVGPLVSALSNRFGCRPVCMVGGVIGSAAYALSIFAKPESIEYLMVVQGVIGGVGFGMIYLPAVVAVGYYFESKRALATGIAVCGSGVGTMIFPPLVNYLISEFGWKGTNLLLAGLILNCVWLGALMRPLEVPRMKKKDLLHRLAEEKRAAMETGSLSGSMYLTITLPDGSVERRPRKPMNPDPGVHSHLNLSGYLTPAATSLALPTIQETQGTTPPEQESPTASEINIEKSKSPLPSVAEHDHLDEDESKSLVNGGKNSAPSIVASYRSSASTTKMPRNVSQPVMAKDGSKIIPKNGSVPNFERKYSKVDIANQLKVIPATPKASSTNLRALGSQDLRRVSSGYGRVASTTSFADTESGPSGLRQRRSSKEKQTMMLRPMSRQDIFYSGSISNLREFKSQRSMLNYRESTLNLQGTGASQTVYDALDVVEESQDSGGGCCSCVPDSVRGTLREMMDFSLLKNPVFLLIGIANLFGMLGFYTPFVFLPPAAEEKGIEKTSATFLISIIGITNTVGRVLTGFISDLPMVNPLYVNNVCIILSGICVFVTPFAYSYASFVTLSVFFGFFVSAYISLTSIILVELLGLAQLTSAFGLLILFRGAAAMGGPPIAGSIYDATKSYDVSFYVSGCLLFVCAALHCLVPCVQRRWGQDDMQVRYTTNEDYLPAVLEETEEGEISPDAGDGFGIVLDIKPKNATVQLEKSGERKIMVDTTQNEKGRDSVSSL